MSGIFGGNLGSVNDVIHAVTGGHKKKTEMPEVPNPEPAQKPDYVNMPSPTLISYDPITRAPYKMVNIQKFAQRWGEFNRQEILKNYELSDKLAMSQLDTELRGLQNYAPAAAALKRSETAADNVFNQQQRTAQLQGVMPEVYGQLSAQAARAESFASGRMPSDFEDRALELGIRSQAADYATAGGFGASSSVSRKASDLMSAQQRIQLSQYGDQLLTQNIGTKANLLLAPTEYSNAGSQISVMPSISGSQLAANNLSNINAMTGIPTTTALQGRLQQNQFVTNLEQRTREFNTTNQLATDQFNANTANQFALTKFGYDVGYEGTEAGVATANNEYENSLAMQKYYADIMQDYMQNMQSAMQTQAIFSLIGQFTGGGGGTSSSMGLGSLFKSLMGGGTTEAAGATTAAAAAPTVATGAPLSSTTSAAPVVSTPVTMPSTAATYTPSAQPTVSGEAAPVQAAPAYSGITGSGYSSPIQAYEQATGDSISGGTSLSNPVTQTLVSGADVALNNAGLSYTPVAGSQAIGTTVTGQPMYASTQLLRMSDTSVGQSVVGLNQYMLDGLGVTDEADTAKLNSLGEAASSEETLSSLDTAFQTGDAKTFIEAAMEATQKSGQPEDQFNSVATAKYTAFQLYQNWGQMSPTQKSLAVASLAVQNVTDAKGERIASKPVPATEGVGYKPLKVADAFVLARNGYNVFPLANNWETLNDIHTLSGGATSPEDIASLAKGSGFLGQGKTGQVVPNVRAESLAKNGWYASPHVGVGGVTGKSNATLPGNYTLISNDKTKRVAVPTASLATVAAGEGSGNLINTAAGHGGVSDSAQKLYSSWDGAHNRKASNGAVGGSAMVSGLYGLSRTNPVLFASTVASSFVDPKQNVNYKNDGEYVNYLASTALCRLEKGEKKVGELAGYMKALPAIKELKPESFPGVARAMRAEYAKAGIKSKADAYALTNQAYAEGRINAVDLVGMQKVFNMMYDKNGFNTAYKLATGRERGVELAHKKRRPSGVPGKPEIIETSSTMLSKDDIKALNRQRYARLMQGAAA